MKICARSHTFYESKQNQTYIQRHQIFMLSTVGLQVSFPVEFNNANGLLFHMAQPTSRSTIKPIAWSKPTNSEH